MTTKSKAQGGSKGKTLAQLKARAAEIVADVNDFDLDTRRAVSVALANMKFAETNPQPPTKYTDARYCERELRASVRKAEAGETVANLSGIAEETVTAARTVIDLVEKPNGCPQFIYEALMVALDEAGRLSGIQVWQYTDEDDQLGTGGYSFGAVAHLFKRFDNNAVALEPKRDLAGLISAVLTHPDTPRDLYEEMRRGLARLTEPDAVNEHSDVLRVALAVHKAETEGGEV